MLRSHQRYLILPEQFRLPSNQGCQTLRVPVKFLHISCKGAWYITADTLHIPRSCPVWELVPSLQCKDGHLTSAQVPRVPIHLAVICAVKDSIRLTLEEERENCTCTKLLDFPISKSDLEQQKYCFLCIFIKDIVLLITCLMMTMNPEDAYK